MDSLTRDRTLRLAGVEMRGRPHPGQHYKHGWIPVGAAMDLPTGQTALDAVPAKLTPGPRGHFGDYEGENLTGPPGMGSVTALSGYEGVEYDRVNGYLRHPDSFGGDAIGQELAATAQQHVAEIDKTMAVSRLDHDVQVERVIQRGKSVFGDAYYSADMTSDDFDRQDAGYERWLAGERPDLTGLRFRDQAYVSTSADPRIDQAFGGRWARTAKEMGGSDGEPIVMRIQVPKGTGAVQLGGMGEMGPKGLTDSAEILLDRGLDFEVTADHGVDADGFRRIDVKVVPGG